MLSAAFIGIAGIAAVTHATAYRIRSSNADLAHRIAPYDGRVTALAAAFLAGPEATPENRNRASSIARLALQQDATSVIAASTLGLNAQVINDKAKARRFFRYTEALSRRDIQTQLWAIEDAVGRGDVAEALTHYDIVMRSTPSLSEMLFPVLASASTDPEITGPLIKTLKARPAWGENFISYLSGHSPSPRSTTALLTNLYQAGVPVPPSAQATTINTLLAAGFSEDAWDYYVLIHPKSDRKRSRDPRFINADFASLFDWVPQTVTGTSASIQDAGQYGLFDFSAPAMVGGTLLQQLQLLPPGKYELVGHSIGIDQMANVRPYWRLACQDGRELGRIAIPNSSDSGGNFVGTLSVPEGCPIQILSMVAQPTEGLSGLSGQIDFVELYPVK
ncbi:MAG: hypothetical protein V4530_09925 [Pseudomonadota bacterium]